MTKNSRKTEVLAVIPARGGSKGIPRKNIIDLCGKPLIAYSIEAALRSRCIDRVVVSTDDAEIARVAEEYGADVPFIRSAALAGDSAYLGDVFDDMLQRLDEQGYTADYLVRLYPTSIFRNPWLISFLVNKLFEGYRTVKAVRPIHACLKGLTVLDGQGLVVPLPMDKNARRTADWPCFKSTGLFQASSIECDQPLGTYLHHISDDISLVDIDNYSDLFLAQQIIEQGLFDFNLS